MRAIETATDPGGTHYASTVVTLYDPKRMQVRADVRLENVPQVQPGQKVRIETAAVPKPLEGEVLFATALTNIGKNTLQVKVSITDPPGTLKPGMLSDLTFLRPPSVEKAGGESKQLRLFIPRALVDFRRPRARRSGSPTRPPESHAVAPSRSAEPHRAILSKSPPA